jgi:hypothetical protein
MFHCLVPKQVVIYGYIILLLVDKIGIVLNRVDKTSFWVLAKVAA